MNHDLIWSSAITGLSNPMMRTSKPKLGLPRREQIMDFIAQSDRHVSKREIAKRFGVYGNDKILLKELLKDMVDERLIDIGKGRAFHKLGDLPKVTVLRIVDVNGSRAIAVPERWEAEGQPPMRLQVWEKKDSTALQVGDRILARTEEARQGWIAHPMKTLAKGDDKIMGVVTAGEGDGLWLKPVDKRVRYQTKIVDAGNAKPGDLVLAEIGGCLPRNVASVSQVLGNPFVPRSLSLIAIHRLGIPNVFPDKTLAEAEQVAHLPLHADKREDLRHLPIVTIDPVDARDFDDAIWATTDDDANNIGGWKVVVAIADVSFYVRPGSSLDRQARKHGNSIYFPDLVVPMLPHALSSDICSLKASRDRAAMACHLRFDAHGKVLDWRFSRAIIRVAANITYENAQVAIDGAEGRGSGANLLEEAPNAHSPSRLAGDVPADLAEQTLRPLWACWKALARARGARAPLELNLPERRVVLDEVGRIASIAICERLDAHRLIEDYMIAANVAAVKALEAEKAPVMYRVHEPPSYEKLVALKEYLANFGMEFALGQMIRPVTFNHLIARVGEAEWRPQVIEQILRTQTQAYYAPSNLGHFGLALGSYAHFTSPIRRYSDLLIHRSLVGAYRLELPAPSDKAIPRETTLSSDDQANLGRIGKLISQYERRAMEAERETTDRYVAAHLSRHVGEIVKTRIIGVHTFGFFVTVEGLGGDGLVPISTLGAERFHYDEVSQTLEGEQSGDSYRPGQWLELRLAEANPISGALRFELT